MSSSTDAFRKDRTSARSYEWGLDSGQVVAEAPVAIFAIVILVALLLQPAIVLYDKVVIANAAAESCRLLVTDMEYSQGSNHSGNVDSFVKRRLAGIPDNEYFMAEDPVITKTGGSDSKSIKVTISVKLRPLPIYDIAARGIGATGADGLIEVKSTAQTWPREPSDVSGPWTGTPAK